MDSITQKLCCQEGRRWEGGDGTGEGTPPPPNTCSMRGTAKRQSLWNDSYISRSSKSAEWVAGIRDGSRHNPGLDQRDGGRRVHGLGRQTARRLHRAGARIPHRGQLPDLLATRADQRRERVRVRGQATSPRSQRRRHLRHHHRRLRVSSSTLTAVVGRSRLLARWPETHSRIVSGM